jgi:endonuclease/exonuclease/phosphatase family metal-dependent hydrolase
MRSPDILLQVPYLQIPTHRTDVQQRTTSRCQTPESSRASSGLSQPGDEDLSGLDAVLAMLHPIRVITYNLHKGVGRGGRQTLIAAVDALQQCAPDVLACQEVFHPPTGQRGQSDQIRKLLNHAHVFAPNTFYRRGCHGNATFTSLAVLAHANIDVTESYFERRGILRTRLRHQDGELELLNVHFSLTRRQRERQWAKLASTVLQASDVPVLVCGDFNDWSADLDRKAMRTGLLHNALWTLPKPARRTFPSRRPLLALDRIYFRGLRLLAIDVLRGPPWSALSDHLPVQATFAFVS